MDIQDAMNIGNTVDVGDVLDGLAKYQPDLIDILLIFPLAILYVLGAGYVASKCKERFSLKTNYSRKIFHFIVFSTAFGMGVIFPIHRIAAFGAGAGIVVLLLVLRKDHPRLKGIYDTLAREQDEPHRSYFLIVPYFATALGGLATGILFSGFFQVGYLVAGWGDAAGEPVGVRYGKHKYKVPTLSETVCYRSIEGSIGVFVCSYIAALVVLVSLDHGMSSMALALGAALLATLVEAVSPHGWDNFTTQFMACAGVYLVDSIL